MDFAFLFQLWVTKRFEIGCEIWILWNIRNDYWQHFEGNLFWLLFGTDFSQDYDKLFKSFIICSKDSIWTSKNSLSQEFILNLSLIHVMSQRKLSKPERNHSIEINLSVLVLKNLSKSGYCIVSCMIELRGFAFLFFNTWIHLIVNCVLEATKAEISQISKGWTSMLGYHSNSINWSLSNSCKFGIRVATNLVYNLLIYWSKEIWS